MSHRSFGASMNLTHESEDRRNTSAVSRGVSIVRAARCRDGLDVPFLPFIPGTNVYLCGQCKRVICERMRRFSPSLSKGVDSPYAEKAGPMLMRDIHLRF